MAPSGAINYLKNAPAEASKNLAAVAASGASAINLTSVKPSKPTYQAPAPQQVEEIKTTNINSFDDYQDNSLDESIDLLNR